MQNNILNMRDTIERVEWKAELEEYIQKGEFISPYVFPGYEIIFSLKPTVDKILNETARMYNLTNEDILINKSRIRKNVDARVTFVALLKHYHNPTVTSIGKYMSKDHSTIVHYLKSHANYYSIDLDYRMRYDQIKRNFLT